MTRAPPNGTIDGDGVWLAGRWLPNGCSPFRIRVTGPGIDCTYTVSDAEDIEIVEKVMKKIAACFSTQANRSVEQGKVK